MQSTFLLLLLHNNLYCEWTRSGLYWKSYVYCKMLESEQGTKIIQADRAIKQNTPSIPGKTVLTQN